MDKQEIYSYLNEKNIWHEITEHKAVYNMADLADVEIPYPDGDAKNIFIRDDKKKNFYLITVKGDKRVDLKTFRNVYETRPLSFVSENDMVKMVSYKGNIFSVEPPMFVELEITETEPGVKGDTATNVTKPATVETGAQVNVPIFVNQGDKIQIDTRTGEYLKRI